LGAGGMGEVCWATGTRLNRQVALKVLPQIFAQDEQRITIVDAQASARGTCACIKGAIQNA
ncbi:MAG: hypothetical protein WAO20_06590, partial [Acidobacteriota bacterium]